MAYSSAVPPELTASIGSEATDFVVHAGRNKPLKESLRGVWFGLVWLLFTGVFIAIFIGPLFVGNEVQFESDRGPVTASLDNLEPLYMPIVLLSFFFLIGLFVLVLSSVQLFKPGGWYAATEKRLIMYRKNQIRSIDWEQFSGDIEVRGSAEKGDIILGMRTGQRVRRQDTESYIPDKIFIAAVENAYDLERKCRQRIEENDPT